MLNRTIHLIFVFGGACAFAQLPALDEPRPRAGRKVVAPPPETIDDPPAPPSALQLRAESPRMIVQRGPFTSVQVNVNAGGNNILGDAANEPSITISKVDPARMAITWRQFDTIASNFRQAGRAYSTDGGATWTFPGPLDPGQFRSDPVLDSDAAGNFYFSSLSSATSAEVFKSIDGGVTWGPEVPAFGGDKQWLAVDDRPTGQMGAGHVYQHWNIQFSCCGATDFTRSINGAASFQPPLAIPAPSMKWGTSDVAPDGTLYICGSTLNQTGHLVARSSNAKNPGATPTFELVSSVNLGGVTGGFGGNDPNPGGLLGQVQIWADPSNSNRIFMLGSVVPLSGNPLDVKFIRSINRGESWSAPVTINDDGVSGAFHWFGTMSVAPNGRIDVVWNDTRNTGAVNLSETFYSFSVDSGFTWSPNVAVTPVWNSHIGWPNQSKIGDYYHMLSDNAGASLAYSATFNGEQDVYFLRIIADCNSNGIPDPQDVLNGAPDCNGNEIPDFCEPDADCNGNGIQDICDIAGPTSGDCNLNLVPDECEGFADCNDNQVPDFCDIANSTSADCNENQRPDECDIADMTSMDTNADLIPDECEGACCLQGNACQLSTFAQCSEDAGIFQGLGTTCQTVICGIPNDDCVNAQSLPIAPSVSAAFNNTQAFLDGPNPVTCDAGVIPIGGDLWYEYIAPCTGTATFSLCSGTNFDAVLLIYGGTSSCNCPPTVSQLNCSDDSCGGPGGPATITLGVLGGQCYLIRVAGYDQSRGSGLLSISYNTSCSLNPQPLADPSGMRKNRYLSFFVPATNGFDTRTALQVALTSLHHPSPPNLPQFPPPIFADFEGQVRWVGPPGICQEDEQPPTTFTCAELQCTPHYANFSSLGLVHVTGAEVVPSSLYGVRTYAFPCEGNEENCTAVSEPRGISTGRWGDVIAPFQDPLAGALTQPDIADVAAIVDKFRGVSTEPRVSRADLQPALVDFVVNIADVASAVDAFEFFAYPFSQMPSCP